MKGSKAIYIGILSILTVLLLLGYIPGLSGVSSLVTPPLALFTGLVFALVFGQPYPSFNKKVSKKLLQYSVVGLGFGMNLFESLESSKEGMMLTIVSVVGTMIVGMLIGYKMLKINKNTAYLISCGTAICGGSAIAAVGPVLKSKDTEMSVALATIFILNAIALFVFPILGELLGLTQQASPREREGPDAKRWEGWSRNKFRRNQAKLTLPSLLSYPYKYERR